MKDHRQLWTNRSIVDEAIGKAQRKRRAPVWYQLAAPRREAPRAYLEIPDLPDYDPLQRERYERELEALAPRRGVRIIDLT